MIQFFDLFNLAVAAVPLVGGLFAGPRGRDVFSCFVFFVLIGETEGAGCFFFGVTQI